ncbi:MAG: O-antigen ligase family protein [Actinobacteria bacterium]|nr:O-antigen ligase family protein [Actinomycetota bacterium]
MIRSNLTTSPTTHCSPDIASGGANTVLVTLLLAAVSLPIWAMRPLDFVKFGDIKYQLVMGIALTAGLALLVEAVAVGGFRLRASPSLWALGVLVIDGLAASLASEDPTVAVTGNLIRRDGYLMLLGNAMLFLIAYSVSAGRVRCVARMLATAVVLAALPVWAYAFAQSLGADPFVWEPFRGESGRVFSTLGNPIFLGAYSMMASLVALGLWMDRGRRLRRWWLAAAALGVGVTGLTASRAAWLGLALGCLALCWPALRARALTRLVVGAVAAAVLGVSLVGLLAWVGTPAQRTMLTQSVQTLSDPGAGRNAGRVAIWNITLEMIRDHPYLGVGPDLMGARFEEYRTAGYDAAEGEDRIADKPHSVVLEWGVETGIPGAVLFSGLVLGVLYLGAGVATAASQEAAERWALAGIWAAAVAYMGQSLITVTAIGVDGVWWVLLGTLSGAFVALAPRNPAPSHGGKT